MERLTHEADFGLEDWEETLFFVKSDPNGAYNILDIAKYQGNPEFDEILKHIALRLSSIENILGDEYDLDRLSLLCNQRMTMREEVSQRFSLTAKIPLDRLREMAEAERDGRCVVLPCKLGDTVYFITGTYNSLVKPAKVEEIYIGDGSIALGVSTDFTTFTLQESEWHLTREEAEAALAKLNSET